MKDIYFMIVECSGNGMIYDSVTDNTSTHPAIKYNAAIDIPYYDCHFTAYFPVVK